MFFSPVFLGLVARDQIRESREKEAIKRFVWRVSESSPSDRIIKNHKQMNKAILAITLLLATALVPAQARERDTTHFRQVEVFTLYGGTSMYQMGSTGINGSLHYQTNLGASRWMLGVQYNAASVHTPDSFQTEGSNRTLFGVDVTIGFREEFGWFYVQPTALIGASSLNKNTVLWGDLAVRRDQGFLAWEGGVRLEAGFRIGPVGVGVFAEKKWQDSRYTPTTADGMEIKAEWATHSPFTAGVAASVNLDHGVRHRGGNNVPLIEAFGAYGTRGFEAGGKVLFSRNGFFGSGIRVFSTEYGFSASRTISQPQLLTAQIFGGLVFHWDGPDSPLMAKIRLGGGVGELPVWMDNTGTTAVYDGYVWTVQPTLKGTIEAQLVFRHPEARRAYGFVGGGISGDIVPGTEVSGPIEITNDGAEKPWTAYISLGLGWSL